MEPIQPHAEIPYAPQAVLPTVLDSAAINDGSSSEELFAWRYVPKAIVISWQLASCAFTLSANFFYSSGKRILGRFRNSKDGFTHSSCIVQLARSVDFLRPCCWRRVAHIPPGSVQPRRNEIAQARLVGRWPRLDDGILSIQSQIGAV